MIYVNLNDGLGNPCLLGLLFNASRELANEPFMFLVLNCFISANPGTGIVILIIKKLELANVIVRCMIRELSKAGGIYP